MSDIFTLLSAKTPKGISEEQLVKWSQQGATTTAKNTHEKIRSVVERIQWNGPKPNIYLQGSYKNSTNIRGDSDVDIVIELTPLKSAFSKHVDQIQRFIGYKNLIFSALEREFAGVKLSEKCIKIPRTNWTIPADVVPAFSVQNASPLSLFYTPGMRFFVQKQQRWVINHPRQHFDNGALKNARTAGLFKPTVRMFKNALSYPGHNFPGYFVECLLYNVPDELFLAGRQPLGALLLAPERQLRARYQTITRWLTYCSLRIYTAL